VGDRQVIEGLEGGAYRQDPPTNAAIGCQQRNGTGLNSTAAHSQTHQTKAVRSAALEQHVLDHV
jgi:hypothetical protein